ncbi:MAG TPA: ribosome maturation factor [Treponema sp.]|nr:ribosome maturation factor [Treponema sp.]HAK69683.1 ribosome maturation factor [Treponema sp.]HBB42299.1 ribosome maturation factor [Treponema sp.]HCA20398.1 ribosome maturation factor [Treponema sp.]
MNYISTDTIPYFKDCSAVVSSAGYMLVELQIVPQKGSVHITAVIASKDSEKDIGVADCSKAHHALQPKLISLLGVDEDSVYMEVCSPGMERNIKNAAEFAFFVGRDIRVWDKTVNDWVSGKIKSSDETQVTLAKEDGGDFSVAYENIAKAKFIHL